MKTALMFFAWLFGMAWYFFPQETATRYGNPFFSPSHSSKVKNKRLRLQHS